MTIEERYRETIDRLTKAFQDGAYAAEVTKAVLLALPAQYQGAPWSPVLQHRASRKHDPELWLTWNRPSSESLREGPDPTWADIKGLWDAFEPLPQFRVTDGLTVAFTTNPDAHYGVPEPVSPFRIEIGTESIWSHLRQVEWSAVVGGHKVRFILALPDTMAILQALGYQGPSYDTRGNLTQTGALSRERSPLRYIRTSQMEVTRYGGRPVVVWNSGDGDHSDVTPQDLFSHVTTQEVSRV